MNFSFAAANGNAKVIRENQTMLIPAKDVVVGDVCLLSTGDNVITDGLMVENNGLVINESFVTAKMSPTVKDVNSDIVLLSGRKRIKSLITSNYFLFKVAK